MLYDFFNYGNHLAKASIQETFDKVNISYIPESPIKEFITKLFDELKTISKRDNFELFVDIEGNHVSINNTTSESFLLLEKHLNENESSGQYDISLTVNKKKIDSTISIYFIDIFSDYIHGEDIFNIISLLSKDFEKNILFEVYSTIDSSSSTGFSFFQSGQTPRVDSILTDDKRKQQLDLFSDYSTNHNFKLKIIPSDFFLIPESNSKICNFFKNCCSLLSIIFLSNSSSIENGKLSYKIFGYKTISSTVEIPFDLKNDVEILYKIYSWSYEDGTSSDKIGLVRNILSIHLDINNNIKFDKNVWDSIRSNYQVYLRGNIQSYLEIKSKISDYLIEFNSKTFSMVDQLVDSMKANCLVIATYLFTVVLVDGIKDNGIIAIFSQTYLNVVAILSIFSLLWIFFIRSETINKFSISAKSIKDIVKLNYGNLIMENEINESIDPIVIENKAYLDEQVKKYSKWWLFFILTFFILFYLSKITLSE
jgi:hypothetical protein